MPENRENSISFKYCERIEIYYIYEIKMSILLRFCNFIFVSERIIPKADKSVLPGLSEFFLSFIRAAYKLLQNGYS